MMNIALRPVDTTALQQQAAALRGKVIGMSHAAQAAHLASCLSCADILVAAYWHVLEIDPEMADAPLRDRFILSKGHAAAALYATLAMKGFFPLDELDTAALVAVQQARGDRTTIGIHGRHRRHHRGHRDRQRVRPIQHVQRGERTLPPRFVGVVFQPIRRRHPQFVRNTRARDHPAVGVCGNRFDRGGADVDADCDLFA